MFSNVNEKTIKNATHISNFIMINGSHVFEKEKETLESF